eukprot:300490-Rhodomonas_salina.1
MPSNHDEEVRREYRRVTGQLFHRGTLPVQVDTGAPPVPNPHPSPPHPGPPAPAPPHPLPAPPPQRPLAPRPTPTEVPGNDLHTWPEEDDEDDEDPEGIPPHIPGLPKQHAYEQPPPQPPRPAGSPPSHAYEQPQHQPPLPPGLPPPQHGYYQPPPHPQHAYYQQPLGELDTTVNRIENTIAVPNDNLRTFRYNGEYEQELSNLLDKLLPEDQKDTFKLVSTFVIEIASTTTPDSWQQVDHVIYYTRDGLSFEENNVWSDEAQTNQTVCLCTTSNPLSREFPFQKQEGEEWAMFDHIQQYNCNPATAQHLHIMAGRWQVLPITLKTDAPDQHLFPLTAVSSGVPPLMLQGDLSSLCRLSKVYIDCTTSVMNKIEYFLRSHLASRIGDNALAYARDNGGGFPCTRWNPVSLNGMTDLFNFIGNKKAKADANEQTASLLTEYICASTQPFLNVVNDTLDRQTKLERALSDALIFAGARRREQQVVKDLLQEIMLGILSMFSTDDKPEKDAIMAKLQSMNAEETYVKDYFNIALMRTVCENVKATCTKYFDTLELLKLFELQLQTYSTHYEGNCSAFEEMFRRHNVNATSTLQAVLMTVSSTLKEKK